MSILTRPMPLVLYDGECGFCSASMRRWMISGKGRLEFAAVQSGAGADYGFPANQPMGALHLIEENGRVRRGAEAVFRMMMLCDSFSGSVASRMYEKMTLFRIISEWGYRRVAERRSSLSRLSCRLAD